MDRTSRIGIGVCLLLLIGLQFYTDKYYPPPKPRPVIKAAGPMAAAHMSEEPGIPGEAAPPTPQVAQTFTVLENDAMKVTLTNVGASITEIQLKNQRADSGGNIILNEHAHSNILALQGWPGAGTASFTAQENPGQGVIFTGDLPGGMKWQRTYAFRPENQSDQGMSGFLRRFSRWMGRKLNEPEAKPLVYTLDVSDSLTNTTAADVTLPGYSLSVGRAVPLRVGGHYQEISNTYLGSGWLTTRFHLTTVNDFLPGYFFVVKTHDGRDEFSSVSVDPAPLRWMGVENQFFTVLLTPVVERSMQSGTFRCFNPRDSDGKLTVEKDPENYILPGYEPDIEAAANFPAVVVPAGKTVALDYNLYAGPKDFNRLDELGQGQGALMNYDGVLPFSLLIVPMLTVLKFWYLIFHNYGVAIILLTLIIKAFTWPLQSKANQSGKKMQALAPMLKDIQAKYKEKPEELQKETFALYKQYGVNPFGGCLPAFVQMPVFFSLYFMLQNAVELRGQSFLWVHDLTQPDSVASVALPFVIPFFNTSHLALHPLPIIVTGLMAVMMRLTPQMGDPTQQKVAQFMPIIFLVIFYNFAAALSLYYVINNCVSIIQIYRNLKKPLPELKRKPKK